MKITKKRKKSTFITLMITTMIVLAGCDTDYDSALLGRWRNEYGGYFELWADGNFETNLTEDVEYFKSAMEKDGEESWSCSDGLLTFAWEHSVTCEYDYRDKGSGEWNVLSIIGNGTTFLDIGNGRKEYRKRSEGMLGQWDDGFLGYFIFEEDGTGTYSYTEGSSILDLTSVEVPIEWAFDDDYLYLRYTNALSFDYYITSEDTLTLYDDNGSLEFKKITSHH